MEQRMLQVVPFRKESFIIPGELEVVILPLQAGCSNTPCREEENVYNIPQNLDTVIR